MRDTGTLSHVTYEGEGERWGSSRGVERVGHESALIGRWRKKGGGLLSEAQRTELDLNISLEFAAFVASSSAGTSEMVTLA